jgi:hypothetical protein
MSLNGASLLVNDGDLGLALHLGRGARPRGPRIDLHAQGAATGQTRANQRRLRLATSGRKAISIACMPALFLISNGKRPITGGRPARLSPFSGGIHLIIQPILALLPYLVDSCGSF